jgi:bifunctional UDP-N-acetylglucosamine pyrophosphorylase/glucosamine-1-phosphate N-acetyltransferase
MSLLNIIILAGGESSRLFPLKEKNLFPFLGKVPLEIHLERVKKVNPGKIVLNINKTSRKLLEEILRKHPGRNIEIVEQKGYGMAGGVLTGLSRINPDEELLVLNSNDFYSDSLFSDFQKLRKDLVTNGFSMIVGYETKNYFPGGYLELKNGFITNIIEKPGEGNAPSDYVNIVFHYFPKAGILQEALKRAKSVNDDVYEVALASLMKKLLKFKMLKYSGEWKSIKYPWHILDVMNFYLEQIKGQKISKSVQISGKSTIKGNVIIEDGVKIFEGAVINGPVYLGKNTIVANNALVRDSIIGEGCVIGYATEVARSYLKSNVWLHKDYVGDSVFEDNVSLGSNVITSNLRLDEQDIFIDIKGTKVNTNRNKLGVLIGSNVRIGSGVLLMPGVKIGSGSFVGPGVILESDVEENKFIRIKQQIKVSKNKFDITKTSRDQFSKKIK